MFRKTLLAVFVFVAMAVSAGAKPKYVFLFIGDGMSVPQRMVAEEYSLKTGGGALHMNSMPYQASTRTKAANSIVTDSAAAATAIACGRKTNNSMLGVLPDGTRLESVAEVAKKSGMKVGIMTTVTITHATPAGFYAHRKSRGQSYRIGLDLVASGFDYFAGGGFGGRHDDSKDPEYRGDVFELARKAGYQVVTNRSEWAALKPGSKSWSMLTPGTMPYAIDDDGSSPSLSDLVAKGIEVLDGEKGFFIMCEGGTIDYAAHANDPATTIREVIALDAAVKVALDFAKKHPEETLVIVTGDHETGGMTLGFSGAKRFAVELLAKQKCSTSKFSNKVKQMLKDDVDLPFSKVQSLLSSNYGLYFGSNRENPMRVRSAELKLLKDALETDREYTKKRVQDTTAYNAKRRYVFAAAVKNVVSAHTGIGWTTGSHTALPTFTTAQGACADIVVGMQENTDIANRLKKLLSE